MAVSYRRGYGKGWMQLLEAQQWRPTAARHKLEEELFLLFVEVAHYFPEQSNRVVVVFIVVWRRESCVWVSTQWGCIQGNKYSGTQKCPACSVVLEHRNVLHTCIVVLGHRSILNITTYLCISYVSWDPPHRWVREHRISASAARSDWRDAASGRVLPAPVLLWSFGTAGVAECWVYSEPPSRCIPGSCPGLPPAPPLCASARIPTYSTMCA